MLRSSSQTKLISLSRTFQKQQLASSLTLDWNAFHSHNKGTPSRTFSTVPSWATLDPKALGVDSTPHYVQNIVTGSWQPESSIKNKIVIPHPLDRDAPPIFTLADTSVEELGPFIKSMESVPKSGVHNPLRNVDRYLAYGDISRKVCTFI